MRVFKDIKDACRVGYLDFPNGSRYMGDWEDGVREGFGVLIEKTQNRYEGEWKYDKEHGFGVKTWKGGSRYEGQWADGKKTWLCENNLGGWRVEGRHVSR